MCHHLTIFEDVCCLAEIPISKLTDLCTFIQQYVRTHIPQSGILIYTLVGQFLKYSQFGMNFRIKVRNVCLSIQESCSKIFSLFINILRHILTHNLTHITACLGLSIIRRTYFKIFVYLLLILFRYKCIFSSLQYVSSVHFYILL